MQRVRRDMLIDLAFHTLTAEKVAIQPARAMVAAGTYFPPNSQIFMVKRAVSLQDLHVSLCVSTSFRHVRSCSDTQFYSPQDMFSYCEVATFILGSSMLIASLN
jgi:hypothetical protein